MNYISKVVVVGVCTWLGVLSGTGCSSSSDDSGPVPLDQFPQTFAKAICDGLKPCCGKAGFAYSDAECKGRMTDQYTSVVTANTGPNSKYDPGAAGDCLSALRKQFASCSSEGEDIKECEAVFAGTLPNGAICQSDAGCTSHYCDTNQQTPVCVAVGSSESGGPAHGKAGDACDQTCQGGSDGTVDLTCFANPQSVGACYLSDGLYCPYQPLIVSPDQQPVAQVCTKVPALGEPCDGSACAEGAFCDDSNIGAQSTCVAQKDAGPCNRAEVCSSKSYCAGFNGTSGSGECVAQKPDGYACVSAYECKTGSCGGGTETHRTCGPHALADEETCTGVTAPAP